MKDYAKIKALASSILECIGDDDEGENPNIPVQDKQINDGGTEPNVKFLGTKDETGVEDVGEKKKKKDSASLAMMGSMLSSHFSKKGK
jgi:hypothetical protein